MSNETNIEELERLAKAAAPGPWRRQDFRSSGEKNGIDDSDGDVVCASYGRLRPTSFDFIAAANPSAVLSLIDRLKKAEAELERERMRLAACGVVAMADTPESAAKAREMRDEYRSASCDDVARRVDECMTLRAERDALSADLSVAKITIDRMRPAQKIQTGEVWHWQGEGDFLESLVCPVLINPHDLRGIVSERDALAAKLKDAEHDRDEFRRVMNGFAEKMAELEGQEPVSWVEVVSTHEGPYNFEGMALLGKGNHLLYARPVPAEEGIVTVTTNDAGRCVMVSRQDEDHRILSVIWEAKDVPTEPVNARLLSALIQCRDRFVFYVGHHLDKGDMGKAAENEKFVAIANDAISAAESAPKAGRLTDEEVDICFDGSDGTRIGAARAIETAVLRKNGIEVAE